MNRLLATLVLALALLALGCSEHGTEPEGPGRVVAVAQTITVNTGDSLQVGVVVEDARGNPTNAPVTWAVDRAEYAEVTPGGWIRGLRFGQTFAIASSGNAAPDTVAVVIRKFVTRVVVAPDSVLLLAIGDSASLTPQSLAYKTEVIGIYDWTSRNESIATVDGAGKVRAVNSGDVFIIGQEASGAQDSTFVRVTPPLRLSFDQQYGAVHINPNWDSVMLDVAAREPVVVTVTTSDSAVLSADSVTIPVGARTARLSVRPRSLGTVMVGVRAQGYMPDSGRFEVGEPRIQIDPTFVSGTVLTDYPFGFRITFGTEFDTVVVGRYLIDPVTVRIRSSDTTVLRDTMAAVQADSWEAYFRLRAHGAGPVTYVAEAPDFRSDSLVFQANLAKYHFPSGSVTLGLRQETDRLLFVPVAPLDTLHTTITVEPSGFAEANVWVADPTSASLGLTLRALTLGEGRVIASGLQRLPDTLVLVATSGRLYPPVLGAPPRVGDYLWPLSAMVGDTLGGTHKPMDPVVLRVTSTDPAVLAVDTLVRIPPGSPWSESHGVRVVGPGSAQVIYTDTAGVYPPASTSVVTVTATNAKPPGDD